MHKHITAVGMLSLTFVAGPTQAAPAAAAAPAPIDYPARIQSVENLKQHIAQREERFEMLKKDLLAMDARVEKQIDDIVKNLASLKDSQDSKTKVANIKDDVIEALVRTTSLYRQKRMEVFERMRKDTNVPKEELEIPSRPSTILSATASGRS